MAAFTPARLRQILDELPQPRRYLIALSGGCDSIALLHAMAAIGDGLEAELVAIHINHGLQKEASAWADHCARVCQQLGIRLIRVELGLKPGKGESIEALARDARYGAIRAHLMPGDMLLTAQHQDDQAETLLLQLLRGSGPGGLAAMPRLTPCGAGLHARPLLGFSRQQLRRYAVAQRLQWVEDSSNQELRFDRNFLRQEIIPQLTRRWPGLARTLSRSARHCAEAQQLIDEQARDDLARLRQPEDTLSVSGLNALSAPRQRAALRCWIQNSGFRLPDTRHLERIRREVLQAAVDRNPVVCWQGAELRRYRDRLFLMPPQKPHDATQTLAWDGATPLQLPAGLGTLRTGRGQGGIDPQKWRSGQIEIRFRRGGERCQPAGRRHHHRLKTLLQEHGVPPWERDRIPLVYIEGRLAAVTGLWICEPFASPGNQSGITILKILNNPR